jgi:hypothetical protein
MMSACHTTRLSQVTDSSQINVATHENSLTAPIPASYATEEQTVALASVEEQPAAASTRPYTNQFQQGEVSKYEAINKTAVNAAGIEKSNQAAKVQNKLTLPARMLMKSIAKKAEKLKKKDIQGATEGKEVNNRSYLVLGIILLIAGLVAVLVGNTTLLYILGSVASLLGLVFLLLALL